MSDLKLIREPNAIYRRAVRREVETWNLRLAPERRQRVPRYHPTLLAHANQSMTGDSSVEWPEFIKDRFGRFDRAISLGGGTGVMDERLLRQGLFRRFEMCDLSEEMPKAFIERLKGSDIDCEELLASNQDLNFIELEEERYDCIICNTILHHVVNLEHLLTEVNRALTPEGVLLMVDYVGESRFQWEPGKVGLINGLLEGLYAEGVSCSRLKVRPTSRIVAHTPFEAVRSQETPGLLRHLFAETTVLEQPYFTLIHPVYRCLDFSDWKAPGLSRALEVFCATDRAVSEEGLFMPCMLFGVYGKSAKSFDPVIPWDDARMRSELSVEGLAKVLDVGRRALSRLMLCGNGGFRDFRR